MQLEVLTRRLTELLDRVEAVEEQVSTLAEQLGALSLVVAEAPVAPPAVAAAPPSATPAVAPVGPRSVSSAAARAAAADDRRRYYVVASVPAHSGLGHILGIWHVEWQELCAELPNGRLAGSGCRIRGFDVEADAREYWRLVQTRRRR